MVKRLPNWLKIGPQAGFGPNFTVELEAGFRKKFGLAYCAVFVAVFKLKRFDLTTYSSLLICNRVVTIKSE